MKKLCILFLLALLAPTLLIRGIGHASPGESGLFSAQAQSTSSGEPARFTYTVGTALLKTQWGQGEHYRSRTPVINGETGRIGCFSVAMAQIMKFHEHPRGPLTGIIPVYTTDEGHSIPALDLFGMVLDWKNMRNTYDASASKAEKDAVGVLMNALARGVRVSFPRGGAAISSFDQLAVKYFNYHPSAERLQRSDFSDAEWMALLKEQINAGLPVYYYGDDGDTRVSNHAFVLDGYDAEGNFHINWGWEGVYDGFYSLSKLNPSPEWNFNHNQRAIIKLRPMPANTILAGAGSADSPYLIANEQELALVAAKVTAGDARYRSAHFRLENDIAMRDALMPIGTENDPFMGTFNGNGKVIRNLRVRSTDTHRGLFGYLRGASVKNLGLEAVVIQGGHQTGGIVGEMADFSSVSHCYTSGTIRGHTNVGGIVGRAGRGSIIENCYSTAAVTGVETVAGIVGNLTDNSDASAIRNCVALNPGVTGQTRIHRVFGRWWNAIIRSGNIAFEGMLNALGTHQWDNRTLSGSGGLDISAAAIRADGTIGGRFTAAKGWTVQNGKLPGFGRPVDLPAHLR